MTSSDPRQRFLDLEAQADNLVKTLEGLKNETEKYQSATGQLEDVSRQVQETLRTMNSASKAMKDTATKLNDLGTPEILASQDALASSIAEIDSRLTLLESKLDDVGTQSKRSLLARLITFS